MANCKANYRKALNAPAGLPNTRLQIQTRANQRAVIRFIEIIPQGTAPASAPLAFDIIKQTTAGTGLSDDSANLGRLPTDLTTDCAMQTTVSTGAAGATAEPTAASAIIVREFGTHQVGVRIVEKDIPLEANARYGIRQVAGDLVACRIYMEIEE